MEIEDGEGHQKTHQESGARNWYTGSEMKVAIMNRAVWSTFTVRKSTIPK